MKEEPKYCIFCGTPDNARMTGNGLQCCECNNLLSITDFVRCLSTGNKGCKGKNLFRSLGFPSPDFKKTTKCPKCHQTGQFAEVEI